MTALEQWEALGTQLKNDEATRQKLVADLQAAGEAAQTMNENLKFANAEIARLTALLEGGNEKPNATIGVASHECTYFTTGSVYSEMAKCEAAADYLDLDFMRDLLQMGNQAYWTKALAIMARHFDHGRTHELTLGRWADIDNYDWLQAQIRLVEAARKGYLSGVAGINEPDDADNGGENYSLVKYAAHQKKLYDMVKGDPDLKDLPVASGAIRGANTNWDAATVAQIKACKPFMDEFNFHWYPLSKNQNATEQQVRDAFKHKMDVIRSVWDGPVYMSEAGATSYNVGEERQAWVNMIIIDLAQEAGVKTVVYELIRDNVKSVQSWFGVVNYDGKPTLAAQAIAGKYAKKNR